MAGLGEALLSGFINVVLERFISTETANLVLGKKLGPDLVERLKDALLAPDALVADAEQKQWDNEDVRKWLNSLRDAVYKADDLLDHVNTKAATQKKVRTFLPHFLNFQEREMVNEIERVITRIRDLEQRKDALGLEKISRGSSSWRTPSTSLVKGNVYGRENDKDAIIKKINDSSEQQLSVIPIVGMGGVGKTTLAQWVFSNEDLMKGFGLKAWVCVSEEFDIIEVTKTIIRGNSSSTCNLQDLDFNLLQLNLIEKLSQKRFFIVLDDVWSDDDHKWNNFRTPFQYGDKGSIILLTTRSNEVASVVQTCPPHSLDGLSEDHCWSVFADNACFPEANGNSALEEIGRKIVKKCKGLPLAAETLGRLLRPKHDVKEWNAILMSYIWGFGAKNNKIIPALLISYYHLPAYLKRCFVYCSLYPKDYWFSKDELVLLWMAEDLLWPPKRGETLEEVGYECFDDLASRLFFKPSKHSDKHFGMHDLLHDLAMFLAGGFFCRLEELGKAEEMTIQTRHLSYGSLSHPISKNFDSINKVQSLRTFLQINLSAPSFSIESVACIILPKLKYLRVLSFCSFGELDVLPDSIGELTHLRYLDLSNTGIKTLPGSLCDLYNLQTLKLFNCHKLTMLPDGIYNLVNLRCLNIMETSLEKMPGGMSKLKHLQLLSYFVVGKHKDNGIKELGGLSNLHGGLKIRKLENVANSSEAMAARIMDKAHIDYLSLEWSPSGDAVQNTQIEREKLEELQPCDGLKELVVQRYGGTIFPNWVGHSSYHSMTRVSLRSCSNCCMLPSLGQLPSLQRLNIEDFGGLKGIGDELYKNKDDHSPSDTPFPSLVDLRFDTMPSWEVWHSFDSNAFLRLKSLEIINCPRLAGDLPNHLPALKTLKINGCPKLTGDLPNHLPALKTLKINGCPKLTGDLPNHQQLVCSSSRAPTIRTLRIRQSEKIGLQELPLSLETLSVEGCQLPVESMFQAMTINHPSSLKVIEISGYLSAISLSRDCLPESLEELSIRDCKKLEFPEQRQQKYNLLGLIINNSCDSLTSFSLEVFPNLELLRLTSLRQLQIRRCPKLENMAGERLPSSLLIPRIEESPLLAEHCKMKHPQIWSKISHIRGIKVDGRWVC